MVEIEDINLSSNHLGSKSGKALVENKSWIKLRILNLDCNKFEGDILALLSENNSLKNLQVQCLGGNNIGAEGGAAALSKNVSWTNLTSLNLSENNIGAEGIGALSNNKSWTNLTSPH